MSGCKKSILLRGHSKMSKSALKILQDYFDKNTSFEIVNKSISKYKDIMFKVPYIGGSRNTLTNTLIFSAQVYPFKKY